MRSLILIALLLLTLKTKGKKKIKEVIDSTNKKDKPLRNLQQNNTIEIADYYYPTLQTTKGYIIVPIVATSDIHWNLFEECTDNACYGGASYFSSYLSALREHWGNNVIYVDSGDLFQGGYESKITNGDIVTDFLKTAKCKATALGDHDFYYGQEYIEDKMTQNSDFFLSSNVYQNEDENSTTPLKGQIRTKVYSVPNANIKIGFIGLTTKDALKNSASDLSYASVVDKYAEAIKEASNELKNVQKVNTVVLLAHMGMNCINESSKDINNLGLYNKYENESEKCKTSGELQTLINEITGKGMVDIILGGHTHSNIHYFYNDIPVVIPKQNLHYFNIA